MSSQNTGTKGRALDLLAQNIPSSQVAGILGVTESAVSQLLADEDFVAELDKKRLQLSEADEKFDQKLETAEESALDGVISRIKFGNLQQQLAAFRVLNQAKRRKDSKIQPHQGTGQVTNLILPAVIVPVYVVNKKNEIIEVDGKTMLSATQSQLKEIVKERTGVELAVAENKQQQTQQILESVTRSVVRPVRRQTRQISNSDIVDLI